MQTYFTPACSQPGNSWFGGQQYLTEPLCELISTDDLPLHSGCQQLPMIMAVSEETREFT